LDVGADVGSDVRHDEQEEQIPQVHLSDQGAVDVLHELWQQLAHPEQAPEFHKHFLPHLSGLLAHHPSHLPAVGGAVGFKVGCDVGCGVGTVPEVQSFQPKFLLLESELQLISPVGRIPSGPSLPEYLFPLTLSQS
jgi:hypothetical protein